MLKLKSIGEFIMEGFSVAEDNENKNKITLPVALWIFLATQLIMGIWWAATISADLRNYATDMVQLIDRQNDKIDQLQQKIIVLERINETQNIINNKQGERLAVLENLLNRRR